MATKFDAEKYTTASKVKDFYSDIPTNLDIHPGTKDVLRVRNDQAIIQSVRNLILTDMNERPFQPKVGSSIRQALFEPISPITSHAIRIAIEDVLNNYEPRVEMLDTVVEPDEMADGYYVHLKFALINKIEPVEIDLFLDRNR